MVVSPFCSLRNIVRREDFKYSIWIVRPGTFTRFWVYADGDDAVRALRRTFELVGECLTHVVNPNWQCRRAAIFTVSQWRVVVETEPGDGNNIGIITGKPSVFWAVGGTGFSGDILAPQHPCALTSTPGYNVAQHRVGNKGYFCIDNTLSWRWCINRGCRLLFVEQLL